MKKVNASQLRPGHVVKVEGKNREVAGTRRGGNTVEVTWADGRYAPTEFDRVEQVTVVEGQSDPAPVATASPPPGSPEAEPDDGAEDEDE